MSTLPARPWTRRLSELQNSAVSLAVLFIFQLPAISMGSILRDDGHSRQLFAFQELERGAPARGRPVDLADQAELGERADRVGSADHRVPVAGCDGLRHGAGSLCELRLLEDAHRAVPEHRPGLADARGEAGARLGADVEAERPWRNA